MRYIPTPSTPPSLAARILPALSPAATHGSSPHIPLDRVRRPLCSISFPEPGTMRQFSGSKAGGIVAIPPPYIGSRTTSLSGWNRRYPADRATRKCRVEHGFRSRLLSTAPSRRVQGLGVPVRAEIFRFDDPNLFSAAESMSLTSATTTPHRWGNFDGEIW